MINNVYPHLFLAGTFDGLHAGHAALLSQAFANGSKVTIGLTSDLFVQKFKIFNSQFSNNEHSMKIKNSKLKIRGHAERKKELQQWLRMHGYEERSAIIPIDDPYEPAASMADLDAIIVTAENRKTGEHINVLRQGATLPALELIDVPMVPAQDGTPISSTKMRNGEIDADGRLIMPESLRPVLGKPMGKVMTATDVERLVRSHLASQGATLRITVGDIATKTFLDAGIRPFLAIIDGKVRRKPYLGCYNAIFKATPYKGRQIKLKSGPGFISNEAMEAIERFFASYVLRPTSYVLLIDGEEDLLVLPAIIHAPVGSLVYYGQPGEGLVEVVVRNAKKKQALALLTQFLS